MLDFILLVLLFVVGIVCVLATVPFLAYGLGILGELTVREAKAIAFEYQGAFRHMDMELVGHHFEITADLKTFVCKGLGTKSYGDCWCIWRWGGWIFYIPWFVKPTKYEDQNKLGDGFGDGYDVFLNEIQREIVVTVLTTDGVTINVKARCRFQVVGPYLFLFVAPKDVVDQALEVVRGATRSCLVLHTAEQVQQLASTITTPAKVTSLWSEIQDNPKSKKAIADIHDAWGIQVIDDSTSIVSVEYDPKYQAALEAKSRSELEALGETARIYSPVIAAKAAGIDAADAVELRKMALAGDNASYAKQDNSNSYHGLPPGLTYFGSGGGGGGKLGVFAGGGQGNRQPRTSGPAGNPLPVQGDGQRKGESDEAAAEGYKREYGVYPSGYDPATKSFK